MALLMFEGFDHWTNPGGGTLYSGAMGTNGIGTWNGGINMAAGTLGGQLFWIYISEVLIYNLGAPSTNASIVGFRFRTDQPAGGARDFFLWCDSTNTVQCGLGTNAANNVIFWRGSNATVLGTGTTVLIAGADYYIEAKVPLGNSVNVEIRVNGVAEIVLTAVDTTQTANQNWQYLQFWTNGSGNRQYYDDFYLCDDTGSAPYNNFLGGLGAAFTGVRVETLFPTANNAVAWTPNASTNVSRVQETATDQDSTYNSSATTAQVDTFAHGSLSSTPTTIFGVKVQSVVRKEDTPIQSSRNKLISGGTTSSGTSHALTTVYQSFEDYYNNDPNTAAAWTVANVNATKIGYENVS